MKEEWKKWFLSKFYPESGKYRWDDRSYSYKNLSIEEVPFHLTLLAYIQSLSILTIDTEYTVYHLHKWQEGDFFSPHIDNNFRRKWAYVCELSPSNCGTSLLVKGEPLKEGIFDSNTLHEVPKIQDGTRYSLTVFGSSTKTPI